MANVAATLGRFLGLKARAEGLGRGGGRVGGGGGHGGGQVGAIIRKTFIAYFSGSLSGPESK